MSRRLVMVRVGRSTVVPVCRTVAEDDQPWFSGALWQRALSILREFLRSKLVRGELVDPGPPCIFQDSGANIQVTVSVRAAAGHLSVLRRAAGRASASYSRMKVLPQQVHCRIEPLPPPALAAAPPGQQLLPQNPPAAADGGASGADAPS